MFFVLGASVVGCGSEFDTLSGKLENLFNRIETIPNTANKCGNKMRLIFHDQFQFKCAQFHSLMSFVLSLTCSANCIRQQDKPNAKMLNVQM